MTRKENSNYIENFWGQKISLVSALVGENGSGKTNIFRSLNNIFSPSLKPPIAFESIYIFENHKDGNNHYFSENLKIRTVEKINKNNIETLYYSPAIDYDLVDINSPINMINYHKDSLFIFYIQNIQRHLFFLKNDDLIETLKSSYPNFPSYEKFTIKANQLYKSDFEQVYIQSTIGNNFYRIRNDLMDMAKYKPFCFENEKHVEKFFNNHKGVQEELKNIWGIYKNTEDPTHLTHAGKNFIKNLEVNILSFLVINDTFTMTGDNGNYDFNKILEAENFSDKLHHFFNKYVIQTSKFFYKILRKEKEEIKIDDSEILFKELNENVSLNEGTLSGGITTKNINSVIKKHILIFSNIVDFYNQIKLLTKSEFAVEIEGGIEIDIQKLDLAIFNKFVETYEFLHYQLTDLVPNKSKEILEIKSTKKLSTGEKALLDLYSSIYNYLNRFGEHQYSENCIFLLDEADLGFHPEWKKRYIKAVVKTLPILMSNRKEAIKNIQIIFATHDPLALSDIPNNNVVYLKKEIDKTVVLTEIERPKQSFGANITDLLADSFFIHDGLIGDFAKEKIDNTIKWINLQIFRKENESENHFELDEVEFLHYKKIIQIIDEPILKMKLAEMIDELKSGAEVQKELAQKEIDYLKTKFDL